MPLTYIGRQVLLHPALVDTALGCEARLLDQFVDGATAGTRERQTAESRVMAHEALYIIAWAVQFQALEHILLPHADGDDANLRERLRSESQKVLRSKVLADHANRVFAETWGLVEPGPLARYDEDGIL
jgi:hypothetical protein